MEAWQLSAKARQVDIRSTGCDFTVNGRMNKLTLFIHGSNFNIKTVFKLAVFLSNLI